MVANKMKWLGQHFLINKEKIKKIVEALELSSYGRSPVGRKNSDVVIEIGPGHGELTDELSIFNSQLSIIAIEKDRRLAQELRNKIYDLGITNIEIVEGDALKLLKSYVLNLKSYKLTGNIPYYITGYLLRIISELEPKPELCVFTIQKEVAERIAAKPPKMNLLAASVQFWAKPEIIDFIPRKDFSPPPKVDSAIIKLETRNKKQETSEINPKTYYKFIKILFKQPRKTILNNLSVANKREIVIERLQKYGINPNARPQNLSIEQIVGISKLLN